MSGVTSSSGHLHCELLRLLFLSAHRETKEYYRLFGMPARPTRTLSDINARHSTLALNGKQVSSSRRLLPYASTSTLMAALSPWAAHTSHMPHTLLASSLPPFLITSSLPAPVIECPGGLLIQPPLALALCSTVLLLLSPALRPLPFTLTSPSLPVLDKSSRVEPGATGERAGLTLEPVCKRRWLWQDTSSWSSNILARIRWICLSRSKIPARGSAALFSHWRGCLSRLRFSGKLYGGPCHAYSSVDGRCC